MIGIEAVGAIGTSAASAAPLITQLGGTSLAPGASPVSFGEMLSSGLQQMDAKVASANELVQRFAVDDSVPLHQVTFALEEARMAVELAMQVRSRLVESYREIMNMQL
jgi:flagellar hook-basal body complex protein FliE